ncbi:hypothetical protein SAMN05661010_02909 [Modicisalibacter muralis]|uniref:MOSC domain-containing protein n=1 Tax=Modicisalibacter muralis TaxID=119000 RepID=A0A1G9P412_9GAMM|nr:MOSC domain-containing protein [Halomonas muralis]SDL93568.1 hypothetical protein SAMN05661010_02909 [Halomonas muralis]
MTLTADSSVLTGLYRYPIKSTAGQALKQASVGEEGLEGDRRYMVVKPDGTFITARTHPQLQRVVAQPIDSGLALAHERLGEITAHQRDFVAAPFATGVWGDEFEALTTTSVLDDWFSQVIGEPARLLWLGQRSPRYRSRIAHRVSFADGYPVMLISQASLDDLNARMTSEQRMSQFRPNLVIAGTAAYAEDSWKRIRIGALEFSVDAPCSRCVMITVDPATGEFLPRREPLRTLAGYRRGEGGKVYFGQNLIAHGEGELELGAPLEVLEIQDGSD